MPLLVRYTCAKNVWGLANCCFWLSLQWRHMDIMASQITAISTVCSIVCSGAHQRKYQSSASLWVESAVTSGYPYQRASNAENVSIWLRHHDQQDCLGTIVMSYPAAAGPEMNPWPIFSWEINVWNDATDILHDRQLSSSLFHGPNTANLGPVNGP